MDSKQRAETIQLFKKIGFPNVTEDALILLSDHFHAANKRFVMVISHTTTHDFLLGLLLFKNSSIPITMFTNFKSPVLKLFAKSLGMLTHQKGVAHTESIIKHLQTKKEFGLLLALGRTQKDEKVHSGYFYIAQKLQVPIIVLGFDYFLKTGTVSTKSWLPSIDQTYENFQAGAEKEILQAIQGICPLKLDFQPGFSAADYPHGNLQGKKINAPNMALLYAHLAKEQCTSYVSELTVVLWVLFGLFLLFLILGLFCKK